jgi:RNA-directed DNA polymerase
VEPGLRPDHAGGRLVAGESQSRVRTAGIDAVTRRHVEARGVERFLGELREDLRAGTFRPLPVRERLIPKRDGRRRRLGIPTLKDRVVQITLKLVVEPIFETGFYPSSTPIGPGAGPQDANAESVHFMKAPSNYEWVIETYIEGASTASHTASSVMRSGAGSGTSVCWRSCARS